MPCEVTKYSFASKLKLLFFSQPMVSESFQIFFDKFQHFLNYFCLKQKITHLYESFVHSRIYVSFVHIVFVALDSFRDTLTDSHQQAVHARRPS